MDMNTEIIVSSEMQKQNELKGKAKVLHICELLGATDYYNAIGGQELYDYESFKEHNIQLNFVKCHLSEYKQFKNEFIPGLSIIDILMFNGKEKTKEMLNDFELVNDKNNRKFLK